MDVVVMIVVACVLFAAGQDHKTQIVLMPDADGHVGQIEVVTDGGAQLLSEAGQMTTVRDSSKAPSEIRLSEEQEIESMFSAALSAEPRLPEKFILYFRPDSADLMPASLELIPQIVSSIQGRNSMDVGIHGNSDRVGEEQYNLNLSRQRTLTVLAILEAEGIAQEIMETASHGEGNPLIKTADGVAEPRNRRVEVVVR